MYIENIITLYKKISEGESLGLGTQTSQLDRDGGRRGRKIFQQKNTCDLQLRFLQTKKGDSLCESPLPIS